MVSEKNSRQLPQERDFKKAEIILHGVRRGELRWNYAITPANSESVMNCSDSASSTAAYLENALLSFSSLSFMNTSCHAILIREVH